MNVKLNISIAREVVNSVNEKEFNGKNNLDKREEQLNISHNGQERRGFEKRVKNNQ